MALIPTPSTRTAGPARPPEVTERRTTPVSEVGRLSPSPRGARSARRVKGRPRMDNEVAMSSAPRLYPSPGQITARSAGIEGQVVTVSPLIRGSVDRVLVAE